MAMAHIRSNSKASPSSANPWEALFASATRPRPVANNGTAATGGYTILLQHSLTPKSQRRSALASTVSRTEPSGPVGGTKNITSSMTAMSLRTAGRGSCFGIAGPFLVRQAFEELCHRCEGSVVFVSTIGTSDIWKPDEYVESGGDNMHGSGEEEIPRNNAQDVLRWRRDALQKFRRHGAVIDFASNPFGWDDDAENDESEPFVQNVSMERLHPIVAAAQRAASHVENRRSPAQSDGRTQQMQHPVPIVFESLTPLLHMHAAEKVTLLLKSIGRSSATGSTEIQQPILSPIVAPVLYESIGPSEHRCVEDMADALVHMNLTDTAGSLSLPPNGRNSTTIASGVMDLVRRGGGGSGLGGKLIRHCVPFRIMRASSSYSRDARAACYWALESEESEHAKYANEGQKTSAESEKPTVVADAGRPGQAGPSRPRIYLDDNDPEFQDFDSEDDLDDDLDL